jgi:acetylornithine deacetylase
MDSTYVKRTLADLVRINSINPAFSAGTTNERAIATYLADAFEALGMEVTQYEPEPGRVSVVGRRRGRGGGRSLMLNGHIDTVAVDEMADPFGAEVRGNRMYGRGAYDMKGGIAACMGAIHALGDEPLGGDVLIAAVADEEVASIGMSEVLKHHHTDGAIVTEPTELAVCLACKGFSWIEIETQGRAAHGSRFDLGIDANLRMGRVLVALEELERALRGRPPHALVGPPSLHAATLHGGTGASTYAAACKAVIERRMLPAETEAAVLAEIQAIIDGQVARARALLTRGGFEARPDAPVVRVLMDTATRHLGAAPPITGASYWMDAALIAQAGIDTAVIGAVGAGAHAAEEWVDLDSVVKVAAILADTTRAFCGTGLAAPERGRT